VREGCRNELIYRSLAMQLSIGLKGEVKKLTMGLPDVNCFFRLEGRRHWGGRGLLPGPRGRSSEIVC
jgi:hypothetical protein